MNQVATNQAAPIVAFKRNLKDMVERGEFALPSTVSPEAFQNAAIIAFQGEGELHRCSPESVFKALRILAGAGLVPDGREAAIVRFGSQAQAMPMVAGLIKVARNSGKVASLWADVVYETEVLEVWIEDGKPRWNHSMTDGERIDAMARGGKIRGAFAVAKMTDGTIDFQPMSRDEIELRRKASANQKGDQPSGIWQKWYGEMAKKTVIRNLAKRLPMSTEDVERIMKEQDAPVLRDVTPETTPAHIPLSQRLQAATQEAEGEPLDGEVMDDGPKDETPSDAPEFDESAVFPGADEYTEGVMAGQAGMKEKMNPHEPGSQQWTDWLGGHKFAVTKGGAE